MTRIQAKDSGRNPRLVLTGGGTSGHVNPALAMGRAFVARLGRAEVRYFGVKDRAEALIVPQAGLPLTFIPAAPYTSPRRPLGFARFAAVLGWGLIKAAFTLWRYKPDYVLATGGYAAAPTVMAQALLGRLGLTRTEVVIHEANAVLGKLNQLMASRADHVFLTFPLSGPKANGLKAKVVGYPVRDTLAVEDKAQARRRLGLDLPPGTRLVLVFGGSQGARTINRAVVEALKFLEECDRPVFVLHGLGLGSRTHHPEEETKSYLTQLYGPDWAERFKGLYRPEIYLHDMAAAYSAADLVVCRAGAGAIHEISALNKAALLIPKPNLPGDHQVQNARALAALGGAEVLYEDVLIRDGRLTPGLDGSVLAQRILDLLSDEDRLESLAKKAGRFMAGRAAEAIARLVLDPEAEEPPRPEGPIPPPPPTHFGLLALLTRACQKDPAAYDPAAVIPDPAELEYYRRRSAQLLVEPSWQLRNVGVKLIGLLGDASKVDHLINLLTDRTPVGRLQRLFGGDFVQVGFIRRNCLTSLIQLDVFTPELEQALEHALTDPYYEVRSHAAKALGHFADRLSDRTGFQARLISALEDKSFEAAGAAALALGRVGVDRRAVEALTGLRLSRYWQLRRAALVSLAELCRRGVAPDAELLKEEVTGFVTTATDFTPRFALKAAYHDLLTAIGRAESDASEGEKG